MQFRTVDVFVKPRHDLQTKSIVGGIITLIATTCSILLLVAQLFWYMVGTTRQSLHLTESRSIPMLPPNNNAGSAAAAAAAAGRHGATSTTSDPFVNNNRLMEAKAKIPVTIHVTFPHLNCDLLQVLWNDAELRSEDFDPIHIPSQTLELRKPRSTELMLAGLLHTKEQHQQHLQEMRKKQHGVVGCTLHTVVRLPIVAGSLTISMTRQAWNDAARAMMIHAQQEQLIRDSGGAIASKHNSDNVITPVLNVSHFIHSIQFGTPFPQATSHPLESKWHAVNSPMSIMTGVASMYLQVKLIPTLYQRGAPFFLSLFMGTSQETYQISLVDHPIKAETLLAQGIPYLPGLTIAYDFTPLAVHHTHDARDNILIFVSSLVSIVGGAFVTVGLITGCLVHSAQAALSKKVD